MQASISEAILPPANPATGPVFWFRADAGVTKDGSNRVSLWGDQSGNGYDVSNSGLSATQPIWTPNAINGLPALDWGQRTGVSTTTVNLQRNLLAGDPAVLKNLAARSIFAVVKPNHDVSDPLLIGGNVCCLDSSGGTYMAQLLQRSGSILDGVSDGPRYYQLNTYTNYFGTAVMVDWEWGGAGDRDNNAVNINGAARPGFLTGGSFVINNTVHRLNVGYDNGAGYTGWTFSGLIAELICYNGILDATSLALTRAYLRGRYGL